MSAFRDVLVVGGVLGAGYLMFRKYGSRFDITSDQNVAYQAADSLAKKVFGDKGTVTDFVPGLNTNTANTTTSSTALAKLSVVPTQFAPYWYNADGSKRTTPMTRGR